MKTTKVDVLLVPLLILGTSCKRSDFAHPLGGKSAGAPVYRPGQFGRSAEFPLPHPSPST